MVSKLHITETTIDSLNQQLAELSRSESLTRAKEQHESIVNAMKKKHEVQLLTLKQKLDEAVLTRDCKVGWKYNYFCLPEISAICLISKIR